MPRKVLNVIQNWQLDAKEGFKKTFRETLMSHLLIAGQVLEETLAFLLMFTALKPEFFMHFSLFAKGLKHF